MLVGGVLPGPKPSLRGGGPPGLRPVPHRAGALGGVGGVLFPAFRPLRGLRRCLSVCCQVDADVRVVWGGRPEGALFL